MYADPYLEKLSEIQMGMENGFDGIPVTDLAEIEEKVGEISVAQDNGWRIIRSGIQPDIRRVCVAGIDIWSRASAVGVPVKTNSHGDISGVNKETQQDKVEYLTAWCMGAKFNPQNKYTPDWFSFTKASEDDYCGGWSRILDGDNLRWKLVNNEYLEVEFVNKKIKKGNVFSTIIPVIYKLVQDGYVINDDKRDAEDTVSIADQNRIRLKDTGNGKFIIADSESRGRLEIKKENTPTY